MKKYAIYNKDNERMYQFPVVYYLDIANSICARQRELYPNAGFHVVQIEGKE